MASECVRILYRADGNAEIGTGHIARAVTILDEFRRQSNCQCQVLTRPSQETIRRLATAGYEWDSIPEQAHPQAELRQFRKLIDSWGPSVAVVDLLDTDHGYMTQLPSEGRVLVTMDDLGEGRVCADLAVNMLVREPAPQRLAAGGTRLLEGPAYVTLGPMYQFGQHEPRTIGEQARRILVSVGGGDADGTILRVARALTLLKDEVSVQFVVGTAFPHRDGLEATLAEAPWEYELAQSLPHLLSALRVADLAIVAGGLTMHEAAYAGTPGVVVAQRIDHQRFLGRFFEEQGVFAYAGPASDISPEHIAGVVSDLLPDAERRRAMSRRGQALVDGQGTQRVVEEILRASDH